MCLTEAGLGVQYILTIIGSTINMIGGLLRLFISTKSFTFDCKQVIHTNSRSYKESGYDKITTRSVLLIDDLVLITCFMFHVS